MPWIGVLGVVIGTLVPQVYQHQQFIIAKTCHQLGDTYGNHLKTSIIKPLLFSGAIYALAGVINIGLTEINYLNITTITIYCLLLTATGLPLYYWLFGSETEKDFLQTLIKKANKPFQRGQNLGSL